MSSAITGGPRKRVAVEMTSSVFLLGFSGCGKSVLGSRLARMLGVPFYDTDRLIEECEGASVVSVFDRKGEKYFRRVESQVIRELALEGSRPAVIALGGGAFESAANRRVISKAGLVVYLSCSLAELYRRLAHDSNRPLLRVKTGKGQSRREAGLARIRKLLKARAPNYRRADRRLATTGKPVGETARQLLRIVRRYYAGNNRTA
jgi:shikimate kinase